MYECPNCGGNLKFEITSQKLFCAFCDTRLEPEAVTKETDTLENDCFEVNVFLCPQCGGQMISGDNDATAFCSYCGAANILSSRISREKRPKYIIPFKKTKEDCKKAYEERIRRAIFAPREFADPKFIDSFRGIYMPYWLYHFTQQGEVTFKGKISTRKGNYLYTDHYDLKGDLNADSQGLSHDASANFYDSISQELAPYDTVGLKAFTPSYLSGFYADVLDVDSDTYLADAADTVNADIFQKICLDPLFKKHNIDKNVPPRKLNFMMHTHCENMDSAMYPVWFLSYRNRDRVAYAAVNGQTGKVALDVPVDPKRYLIGSLLLALPIFVLLNLFLVLRPSVLLTLCGILALIAAVICMRELKTIQMRERHDDDKGMKQKNPEDLENPDGVHSKRSKNPTRKSNSIHLISWIIVLSIAGFALMESMSQLIWLPILIAMAAVCINGLAGRAKSKDARGGLGLLLPLAAVGLGTVTALLNPVSDLWYYGSSLLILASIAFSIVDIIQNYNRLAMRRLPQFDKKGGEDNA